MKISTLLAVALFSASIAALPRALAEDAPRVIEVKGDDTMKFDVTNITVAPGEKIQIVLKNVGTFPKASMGHNLVLLTKGSDPVAFSQSAMMAKDTDYIPDGLKAQIIAHTKLLGPGETDSITITAPTEPGDYPYLCSFPAHCFAGMKGILTVK